MDDYQVERSVFERETFSILIAPVEGQELLFREWLDVAYGDSFKTERIEDILIQP